MMAHENGSSNGSSVKRRKLNNGEQLLQGSDVDMRSDGSNEPRSASKKT